MGINRRGIVYWHWHHQPALITRPQFVQNPPNFGSPLLASCAWSKTWQWLSMVFDLKWVAPRVFGFLPVRSARLRSWTKPSMFTHLAGDIMRNINGSTKTRLQEHYIRKQTNRWKCNIHPFPSTSSELQVSLKNPRNLGKPLLEEDFYYCTSNVTYWRQRKRVRSNFRALLIRV